MQPISTLITDLDRRFGITEKRADECEKHGTYTSCLISRTGKWTGCPVCSRERQQAEDMDELRREREARTAQRIEAMMGRAAIPKRFQNRTLDSYQAETDSQRRILAICRKYAATFPERLIDGKCLLLLGNAGTGKTHLAAAIASEIIRRHNLTALYTTANDAIRKFKDNFTTRERSESEIIALFAAPSLLVMDEIGMGSGTDFELNCLFEIVNARYEENKPTVFVGNVEPGDVRRCLGDRVADRLNEGEGVTCMFKWESARSRF